jgi:ADP-ribose pyrophosphatase
MLPDEVVRYEGRQFQVITRDVASDGQVRRLERVQRVPAVAVLAETAEGLVLIRQHRPVVGEWLWELPAGKVDPGESSEAAARRELEEETGYRAPHLTLLFQYYPSPGYTTEQITLFWAPHVEPGPASPEPDEEIAVDVLARPQVATLLATGQCSNGLLLIGVLWWLHRDHYLA